MLAKKEEFNKLASFSTGGAMRWIVILFYSSLLFAQPEREKLLGILAGEWVSRGVYAAAKFEIADQLASGPKNVSELAEKTGADSDSLQRVLQMLASFGVFEETAPGVFANTDASRLLVKSNPDSLRSLALFYGEEIHQAWDQLFPSLQTGTPAFDLAFEAPVFQYFKEHPKSSALFHAAMREKSRAVIQSALYSYDFSRFKTIYDIGGGQGHFLSALLQKYTHLKGVLFDLPEVIEKFKPAERSSAKAGDFFVSIPEGGDAYLLKSILHDWDDERAKDILQNCHRAMAKDSKLLIVEVVLLSPFAHCMDVLMMAITGGKERSLPEFKKLLDESGFVLERTIPTSTEFSILEARKK